MKLKSTCVLAVFALPFVLMGCAYENRAFDAEQKTLASTIEEKDTFTLGKPLNNRERALTVRSTTEFLSKNTVRTGYYALQLSDAYKKLGDEAARNRDLAAAGLITVAGAAALGNASSISAKDLAIVLAGGALINEGAKWVNSGGASENFYSASESMACASTAIVKYFPGKGSIAATSVALSYIRRIELILRAGLKRDLPDWAALLKAGGVDDKGGIETFNLTTSAGKIEAMETELEACLRQPDEDEQETP